MNYLIRTKTNVTLTIVFPSSYLFQGESSQFIFKGSCNRRLLTIYRSNIIFCSVTQIYLLIQYELTIYKSNESGFKKDFLLLTKERTSPFDRVGK